MKKLLVIGASGSLGMGVIEQLKHTYNITGTYTTRKFSVDNVHSQKLDITDSNNFDSLDKDYDAVFLAAGAMPSMMQGYHPQNYIDVNITGVMNVLEYCRINNIPKLIFIQTFSDVSASFYTGVPIQDDDPRTLTLTGDHAVYVISKVAACELIEHYNQEYGLQTIIFRIPTVYCNDDNYDYFVDGHLKTKAYIKMIRSIVDDSKIDVWGNPQNSKDMPYIKDFAVLIHKATEHKTAQGIFNAGTGDPVSLEVLVDTMIEVFSPEQAVDKTYLIDKPSQPNFTFDMQKTKETFDYNPSFSIKDILIDIKKTLY